MRVSFTICFIAQVDIVENDTIQYELISFEIKIDFLKCGGFFFCFVLFLVFLGPYPWHMKVPRRGVQSEL